MASKNLPVFDNCVVLVIDDKKPIMFYLPTAENAKNLAMMLKRCLREQVFSIDVKYKTPDGFVSAQAGGEKKFNISDSVYVPLQRNKEMKATHKICVELMRTEEYGNNIEFTMYFYSRLDMNITVDLIDLGLQRVYKKIHCYINPSRNGNWIEMARQMYTDERFARAIKRLDQKHLHLALKTIEEFDTVSDSLRDQLYHN